MPSMAVGRLRKKTACQLNSSTRKPPMAGPVAGAITTPKLNSPIAVPRRSGGKTRKMICMESGCSSPAAALRHAAQHHHAGVRGEARED